MAVRYLVPGERASCKACGAKTAVPDDARLVEYAAPRSRVPEAVPEAATRPNECPVCGHPVTPLPQCVACGYQPGNVRLYNPKYFEHLAIFFSGLVPIWMASSNYKRLGQEDRRRRLLVTGIPIYLAVIVGLMALSEVALSSTTTGFVRMGISLLVNYPVGWYLKRQQLPIFAQSKSLGGGTAPMWKGIIAGSVVLGSVVVAAMLLTGPYINRHMNQGRRLMKKREYAAAALAFERALAKDSTDTEAMVKAGLCEVMAGELHASVPRLEQYLRHEPSNARVWVVLASVHDELGNPAAGDSCRRIASRLDPSAVKGP